MHKMYKTRQFSSWGFDESATVHRLNSKNVPLMNFCLCLYLCVSSISSELVEHEGVEKTHVSGHLLHASKLSFFFSIGKFHY